MDKIIIFFFLLALFIGNAYAKTEYYLTLRNDKVNLRQGPSLDHPVKLVYKKKFLPVLIIDSSYNFRKIIDHENNSGWIHISQLSKKQTAINYKNNSILFKKATIYSKPLARLELGRLVIIKKCNLKWCKISSGNFNGWIDKNSLWGNVK